VISKIWQIFPKQLEKLVEFTLSKHQNFPKSPIIFVEKMTKLAGEKKNHYSLRELTTSSFHPMRQNPSPT